MSRVKASPEQAWENFRQRVAELGGVVLEPEWLGARKLHLCRCSNGHQCRPRPDHVREGIGICRICSGYDTAATRDAFYKRVAELGGTVLEPEWRGAVKPHLVRCANGHECRPWPTTLQQGGGLCRTCAGQDPVVAEANFRKRIAELGGVVLEPKWLGSQTPHRCRCIQGHECRPWPSSVQHGQGICRTCAGKDTDVARDAFYARVAELGGEVLEPEWLGSSVLHRCRCGEGHECKPRPSHVQEGVGICQVCAWSEQDALYVTRNPATGCVKFGITNRDGRLRLKKHRTDGYTEILRLETGLPKGLAALTEQKIKLALRMAGAVPMRGYEYFDGEHIALIFNEIDNWVPLASNVA